MSNPPQMPQYSIFKELFCVQYIFLIMFSGYYNSTSLISHIRIAHSVRGVTDTVKLYE